MTQGHTPDSYFRKPDISLIDPHDPIFDMPLSTKVLALVNKDGEIVDYFETIV